MNRKWNYAKKALFGMLILGLASPSFVGCKDYDDDIDDLQKQITENKEAIEANKKAIADIQSAVDAGAILVDVQETSNGIVVKLSNGKSYPITNGKDGNDGNDGAAAPVPTFEIQDGKLVASYADGTSKVVWDKVLSVDDFTFRVEEGHLIVNEKDMGKVSGTDGLTPEIKFEGTKLVIKIGDQTIEKELKGEKGDDADLTPLQLRVNSVNGELEYTKDGNTWTSTGTKVTGEVPALNFEIKDGVLYLNPNEDFTQGAIGSVVPNEFKVGSDGYLYVNGKKTEALVPGVYMKKDVENGTMTIHIPAYDEETNGIKVDVNGIVYEDVVIPLHINKIQVTSVTLVPMTEGGDLKVYKLAGADEDDEPLYATASQLRFRVNPEGATLGTDFKMLEVMDQFKLSRSAGPVFSLLNAKQNEEDGLVYADFKFENVDLTSEDAYTLAAGVENLYTGKVIYSNYTEFKPAGQEITPQFMKLANGKEVVVGEGETPVFELIRVAGKSVNIAENIFVKAKIKEATRAAQELRTIESYGFAAPTFEVKEVLEPGVSSKNIFAVEGTTIKVNDVTFQAQGAEATFSVIAKVGDLTVGTQEIKVKMVEDIKQLNLIKDVVVDNFNGSAREIALALEANAINHFNTHFNVDVTTADNVEVAFKVTDKSGNDATANFTTFDKLSATPKITVNAGTKDGVYNVVMTVTNTVSPTVKVMSETKFTISVHEIKFLEAWKVAEYWQKGADAITIKVDKTTGDFKSDLSKLFNINADLGVKVKYVNKAGETKVKVEGNEAKLMAPKNLAIGGNVSGKIVAQLVNAEDESLVVDEKEIDVTFENPIKSFTVSGEDKLTMLDATASGDQGGVTLDIDKLLTLALNVDNRAGEIVNIIKKDEESGKNAIEPDGGMYGASAIAYSLKGADDRFSINEGKLTWRNTSTALSQEVKAVVVITIENNWKTITKEVTVTVKPN